MRFSKEHIEYLNSISIEKDDINSWIYRWSKYYKDLNNEAPDIVIQSYIKYKAIFDTGLYKPQEFKGWIRNKERIGKTPLDMLYSYVNYVNSAENNKDIKAKRSFETWYFRHKNEYNCKEEAYKYYMCNVKTDYKIAVENHTYNSFREMCLSNGIHPDTIKNFFNRGVAKELNLSVENAKHVMAVINMYNSIRDNKLTINGKVINQLSDISGYSNNEKMQIYSILLYSDKIQIDIDKYIETLHNSKQYEYSMTKENKERNIELEKFRSKCKQAGIKIKSAEYKSAYYARKTHKDWSIDDCIKFALDKNRVIQYKNTRQDYKRLKEEYNLSKEELKQIRGYVRNKDKQGISVSLIEAMKHVIEHNENIDIEWKTKWRKVVELGTLDYAHRNTVQERMKTHLNETPEETFNHFKYKKQEYMEYPNLIEYCKDLDLNYGSVYGYIRRNNSTVEDGILHYRPDCYINWLGQLIIPNKE